MTELHKTDEIVPTADALCLPGASEAPLPDFQCEVSAKAGIWR